MAKEGQEEGWPDMSLDLDQQALDLINAWEAGEYLHPAQKKAALQVRRAVDERRRILAARRHHGAARFHRL